MARIALSLLLLLVAAPATHAGSWRRPVDGPVLRSFAVGSDRFARGWHRGIDLGAPPGSVVRSACGGRVGFTGRVPGGGLTVSVRCGPVLATYQRLGVLAVRRGEAIARGGRVGAVGRSGDAYTPQPHLHLGAREAATGRYLDPLTLLGRRGPAPLLPAGRPRAAPLGPAPVSPRRVPASPREPGRAPGPVGRFAPAVIGPLPAPRPVLIRPAHPSPSSRSPAGLGRGTPSGGSPGSNPPTPWFVWAGVLAFGLALPIGGLATFARRRVSARRRALPSASHSA